MVVNYCQRWIHLTCWPNTIRTNTWHDNVKIPTLLASFKLNTHMPDCCQCSSLIPPGQVLQKICLEIHITSRWPRDEPNKTLYQSVIKIYRFTWPWNDSRDVVPLVHWYPGSCTPPFFMYPVTVYKQSTSWGSWLHFMCSSPSSRW